MRQCPKCGGETADSQPTCGVCDAPLDDIGPAESPLGPAELAAIGLPRPFRPGRAPVGVPRRFSIGTMMILVTAFAVLFAVLKTFSAPPAAFIVITIFVGGIAACQSLLFKGKKPRLASVIGGSVMYGVGMIVATIASSHHEGIDYEMELVYYGALWTLAIGGPLGYIVGCFVASIFLVRKEPDDAEG